MPRIDELMKTWPESVDNAERTRRLLDLFLVSVLLDAGAGTKWHYKTANGRTYRRSEGLAVASLDMFKDGLFSSNPEQKEQVDGMCYNSVGWQISNNGYRNGVEAAYS